MKDSSLARRTREGRGDGGRLQKPLLDTRVVYCGDNLEQLAKLPDACMVLYSNWIMTEIDKARSSISLVANEEKPSTYPAER